MALITSGCVRQRELTTGRCKAHSVAWLEAARATADRLQPRLRNTSESDGQVGLAAPGFIPRHVRGGYASGYAQGYASSGCIYFVVASL